MSSSTRAPGGQRSTPCTVRTLEAMPPSTQSVRLYQTGGKSTGIAEEASMSGTSRLPPCAESSRSSTAAGRPVPSDVRPNVTLRWMLRPARVRSSSRRSGAFERSDLAPTRDRSAHTSDVRLSDQRSRSAAEPARRPALPSGCVASRPALSEPAETPRIRS